MNWIKESNLGQAWLILVLSVIFGAMLAGVQIWLSPLIEQNKLAETYGQIPALVLGNDQILPKDAKIDGNSIEVADQGKTRQLTVEPMTLADHKVYKVTDRQSHQLVGWVVNGSGPGYADTIELLIGLSPDARTLTGLYVLSQKETPTLGDNITSIPLFRGQFFSSHFPANGNLQVSKDGGKVKQISGATISSRSVCDIVNATIKQVKPALQQQVGVK